MKWGSVLVGIPEALSTLDPTIAVVLVVGPPTIYAAGLLLDKKGQP